MTKAEYADVRDIFTDALKAVQQVKEVFTELAYDLGEYTLAHDIPHELDKHGAWLSGDEYTALVDAVALIERFVGRAHERSV